MNPTPAPHPAFSLASLRKHPVVVGAVSTRDGLALLRRDGLAQCDLAELRLDLLDLSVEDVRAEARTLPVPLLLTLRHTREGGRWDGPEEERLDRYRACSGVAAWADLELSAGREAWAAARTMANEEGLRLIGSIHAFDRLLSTGDLRAAVQAGSDLGADVVKAACRVETEDDLTRLDQSLHDLHPRGTLSLIGMGAKGPVSRLQLPLNGSCLTYGAIGEANAPGQPAAADLVRSLLAMHTGYAAWRNG